MSNDETVARLQEDANALVELARREAHERQAKARLDQANHVKACVAAKIDPLIDPTDPSTAKTYVQARAYSMLFQCFNIFEDALKSKDIKLEAKISLSLEMVKRGVGMPTVPAGIKADLSKLAPVDVFDLLLAEHAAGNCTREFVETMCKLLGAKVQSQRLDQMATRAREHTAEPDANA